MKKTVQGITLDLDPRIFNDILTVEMFASVMTPIPDDLDEVGKQAAIAERIRDVMALSRRIFGAKFDAVYAELGARNGGYVEQDEWAQFLNDVLLAYQKNAHARPAPRA